MSCIHGENIVLCGAGRGHYSSPVPYSKNPLRWVDAENWDEKINPPKKFHCEGSDHFDNLRMAKFKGKTDLHGNTASFPLKDMFIQRWVMTKKEMREAIKQYDMFSLEMPPVIICKFCAKANNGN